MTNSKKPTKPNNKPNNETQPQDRPRVAQEPAKSFDERTSSMPPFLSPDGRQNNGQD